MYTRRLPAIPRLTRTVPDGAAALGFYHFTVAARARAAAHKSRAIVYLEYVLLYDIDSTIHSAPYLEYEYSAVALKVV